MPAPVSSAQKQTAAKKPAAPTSKTPVKKAASASKSSASASAAKSNVKKTAAPVKKAAAPVKKAAAPAFDAAALLARVRSAIPEKWIRPLKLAAFDILMIGLGLLVFAYFHHVRQTAYSTDDLITISRPTAALTQPTDIPVLPDETSAPAETAPTDAAVQPEATPQPVDPNDWGAKFPGQFTDGEVESTASSYRSKNISITIRRFSSLDEGGDPQVWFVADIYVRDIEALRTALANDTYGKGYKEWPSFIAYDNNAILAISGDYYGAREKGVVIRNGTVYRSETFKDVCVLYYDGVMETMSASEFDLDAAIGRGAYQAFSFGPALLDENGKVKTRYDSEITDPNPRCAIGYFEPGHYCFVVADGRRMDYSEGLEMHELAQIFEDMGCAAAYNLDGGATAAMIFKNNLVNDPYDNGRKVSDIIYIGEVAE